MNTMSKNNLFLDSSVVVAGAISTSGAANALFMLAVAEKISITISEQVIIESERALALKSPRSLPYYRDLLRMAKPRIVRIPAPSEVAKYLSIIADPTDAPILAAAVKAGSDYLVTLNRKHFLTDPKVAEKSGLRIGTPGDALAWVREQVRK
ncbi:MAG: DNA-binding protein [Anaerolineae bacterium CG_4_9_14_0_8_um_filter_58_9]|nr:MAG: DNA-binding protein [Anaerolineae bacterium CG06_land_8_20_14_3_00_57_67]PJH75245.1 MAG: DNA-binding protein [Anaerolineae bacterium CG_4_9_14_0_8_um_filter_58_9]